MNISGKTLLTVAVLGILGIVAAALITDQDVVVPVGLILLTLSIGVLSVLSIVRAIGLMVLAVVGTAAWGSSLRTTKPHSSRKRALRRRKG